MRKRSVPKGKSYVVVVKYGLTETGVVMPIVAGSKRDALRCAKRMVVARLSFCTREEAIKQKGWFV